MQFQLQLLLFKVTVETNGKQTEEGLKMQGRNNSGIDVKLKTGVIKAVGKLCGFHAFGHQINPSGIIKEGVIRIL